MTAPRPWPVNVARRPATGAVDTTRLKEVVRDTLRLGPDETVVIQQLACSEPGCPPVETVIAVLRADAPARRWTLHQPLTQLNADAIRTALTEGEHQ